MPTELNFNPIVLWGKKRIKQNKNIIIMINGSTGSGKTYAGIDLALKFAKALGTNFSIEENMDFNFTNLLKKAILPKNRTPGTVFLFEEVGATGGGASSREWQGRENINFNSFMQTSRHRNQVIIMTCPDFAYLEKGTRKLVHLQMVMKGIDHRNKISYANTKILQCNPTTGKIYYKYLRFNLKNGSGTATMKETIFNNPPDDVIKAYEEQKEKYTDGLYSGMIENKEKTDKKLSKIKKKCPFCKYEWETITTNPKRCPKCNKRLPGGYFAKENELVVVNSHAI